MRYCLFLSSLLAISVFSCRQENDSPEPPIAPGVLSQFSVSTKTFFPSSKLLKREVAWTKNNPSFKRVRLFDYDAGRRCTEIRLGTIDSSAANPVFTLTHKITFNYNNPTSLMPASLSSVRMIFPDINRTFYYEYNAEGRKILDSVRVKNTAGEPADRAIHYSYEQDRVFTTLTFKGFTLENNSTDTLSLLSGGNIEKLVSRIYRSTGDNIVTYSFTYDKHISPYNKLNIANSLYFESSAIGLGYNVPLENHYMGVTTNNMTSWTTGNYTVRFEYVYDANKYPVRKEMLLPGDAIPYEVTLLEY